jgi:hypothetical protein
MTGGVSRRTEDFLSCFLRFFVAIVASMGRFLEAAVLCGTSLGMC